MALHNNIKIVKILSTYVIIIKISVLRLNGIFFATAHGKSPCDAIGGTVKRLATKSSLQRITENHILTPIQLYKFCKDNVKKVKAIYLPLSDWENENELLKIRHEMAKTIPGTRKSHSFVPINTTELKVKTY